MPVRGEMAGPWRPRIQDWVGAALTAVCLVAPLAGREGAIEAIRNVSSRGPAVFGEVQRSRVNNTDQAIAVGYLLDFVVPWLIQRWLSGEEEDDPAADRGDPLYFDPLLETPGAHKLYFLEYPYAEQFGGYVYTGPWRADRRAGMSAPQGAGARMPRVLRKIMFQNQVTAGYDFGWRLSTIRASSRWEGFGRLSFDTSWAWLRESLGHGKNDQIGLFNANFLLNLVAIPRGRLRAGFGSNFSQDGKNSTRGANLTATIDLFVVEPLVISAAWDAGTLGRAFLLHQRYAVGWMVTRFELALGYDQLRIDNVTIRSPQASLTVYF